MKDYQIHLMDEFRAGRMSRRELLRLASVAGISLATFGSLVGARPARADTPKRGGTVRLAAQFPGKDPESVTASNAGEVFTFQPSLEYLCYPREDWTLDPRLATSWKADPDPKTWTFTIRQGVKWHDGSPLTTDDVVATFQRLLDPKVGSSAGSVYHGVLSFGNVEKVSDTDVRFHLDKAFVDFPYLVSGFAYQSAILPKDYQMGSFTKGGIGTGPFILKEYAPHQYANYVANPNYWASGMPYLDGLKVVYYADESATVLAMQAGDVDNLSGRAAEGRRADPGQSQFHHPAPQLGRLSLGSHAGRPGALPGQARAPGGRLLHRQSGPGEVPVQRRGKRCQRPQLRARLRRHRARQQ